MISVVIPTYNEKENIDELINRIENLRIKNLKIIVVDDDSPDGTGKIVDKLAKKYRNIIVIHRKEKGRASAGLRGFKEAIKLKSDLIMEMDADLSHAPEDIPRFLEKIKECDVVVGSRYSEEGNIEDRSFFRNFISLIVNSYNKIMLNIPIRDISGGFKCYKKEVLESVDLDSFKSTGYTIGAETLYKIKKKGYVIKEIPIIFKNRERGKSKCDYRQILGYPIKILQIRFG